MNKSILLIILISFAFLGCKDDSVGPDPPEPMPTPLIPLAIGNYWMYQGYYLKPEDGTVDFLEKSKWGFVIHNIPSSLQNAIESNYFQMSTCGEDLMPIDDTSYLLYGGSKLVYQGNDGFYYSGIVRKDTVVMKFDDLIFNSKVKKDDSLNGHVFFYSPLGNGSNVPDDVITKYDCISIDSLFTTPLGDFRCIVFKMAYADFENLFRNEVYYFIKQGIGIVGTVEKTYHYSQEKHSYFKKYVLVNYKIKKEK